MYETHFGLRQRPFRAIPNKECYYPATSHEHVLAQLIEAIHDDEGLALLTGEPGTGKHWVARTLHQEGVTRDGPFVSVACGRLPNAALVAVLFGEGSQAWRRGGKLLRRPQTLS